MWVKSSVVVIVFIHYKLKRGLAIKVEILVLGFSWFQISFFVANGGLRTTSVATLAIINLLNLFRSCQLMKNTHC